MCPKGSRGETADEDANVEIRNGRSGGVMTGTVLGKWANLEWGSGGVLIRLHMQHVFKGGDVLS